MDTNKIHVFKKPTCKYNIEYTFHTRFTAKCAGFISLAFNFADI